MKKVAGNTNDLSCPKRWEKKRKSKALFSFSVPVPVPWPRKSGQQEGDVERKRNRGEGEDKMDKKQRTEYSLEEKMAIVRLMTHAGRSQRSLSEEYGVSEPTLRDWRRRYEQKPGSDTQDGKDSKDSKTPDKQVERLKAQIRELENEVAFLKKVSAYFMKSPK